MTPVQASRIFRAAPGPAVRLILAPHKGKAIEFRSERKLRAARVYLRAVKHGHFLSN